MNLCVVLYKGALTDASTTISGLKSTNSSTSLLKNMVRASASVKLSSKVLLVKGFDVIASFKPTSNNQEDIKTDAGTRFNEDGVAIYNMLKLDSECSRIVNTCGESI